MPLDRSVVIKVIIGIHVIDIVLLVMADMVWSVSTCDRYRFCMWLISSYVWPIWFVADIVVSVMIMIMIRIRVSVNNKIITGINPNPKHKL